MRHRFPIAALVAAVLVAQPVLARGRQAGAAAALPAGAVAQTAQSPESARVDALFAQFTQSTPGLAVAVVRDGKLVHAKGYGLANLEHRVPITTKTVFDVGSIAKQFTATCIHMLAAEGKLSLDDDVRKHFPELPKYDGTITVRHLLQHTSGLRDYLTLLTISGRSIVNDYPAPYVLEVIARQRGLNFAPGSEHLYSNTGYFLLAQLVGRASGKSLRQYADEQIFRPLGMKDTHFHDDIFEIVPNRALAYTPTERGFRIDQSIFGVVGDGGLLTTVEDLALWDRHFYESSLAGGNELVRAMETPGALTNGRPIPYASALFVTPYRGLRTIHHSGGWAGYRAEMVRFPDERLTVICLSNAGNMANPVAAARQVAEIYLGAKLAAPQAAAAPPEPKTVELSREQLEARAGLYRDPTTGNLRRVVLADGRLVYERGAGAPSSPLAPVAPDRFRMLGVPMLVEVSFPAPGRMVVAQQGVEEFTFERVEQGTPTAADLAAYAGEYASEELDATHTLEVRDSRLVVRLGPDPDRLPLEPAARDEFTGPAGISVRFTRDTAGRVTGFSLGAGRVRDIRFVRQT